MSFPTLKSRIITDCTGANALLGVLLCAHISCCFDLTCIATFGLSRLIFVYNALLIISFAGVSLVAQCGVLLYAHFLLKQPASFLLHFIACLKICTKRSANPLLDGWYWAVLMCRIPFALQKSSNSIEMNWGSLSLTIVAGSPFLENIVLKAFTVYVDVVVVILTTSGHFEWESNFIKNMAPKKGPAKSMWTLSYGFVGHSHAFSGALFGAFWFCWHPWHLLATVSISWSIPGQQQKLLASVFTCILTTLRCHSWI